MSEASNVSWISLDVVWLLRNRSHFHINCVHCVVFRSIECVLRGFLYSLFKSQSQSIIDITFILLFMCDVMRALAIDLICVLQRPKPKEQSIWRNKSFLINISLNVWLEMQLLMNIPLHIWSCSDTHNIRDHVTVLIRQILLMFFFIPLLKCVMVEIIRCICYQHNTI